MTTAPTEEATTDGALDAVALSLSAFRTMQPPVRSAPLFGIYASMFLGDGATAVVTSAMEGIFVQMSLHGMPTAESVDNLYALLEEFAAVLHVDIADILNRSENRAQTLDEYAAGLANITERSSRRAEDVNEQIASTKSRQIEQRKTVSTIDKEVKSAVKANDFMTAQDRQSALAEAQATLTETESSMKELNSLQNIFEELLDIASKRITALESNREVLIAGLKVVDVPGVDDLGVIEGKLGARKRTGGYSPFRGL